MKESTPIQLYEDNQSCIKLSQSEKKSAGRKHMAIKHHLVKDLQQQRIVELCYCPTDTMVAETLT